MFFSVEVNDKDETVATLMRCCALTKALGLTPKKPQGKREE